MYYQQEIEIGKNFAQWLSTFHEGEEKEADMDDRSKIAICIANVFHKKGRAKFSTKKKDDKTLIVKCVKILKPTK